MSAAGIEMVKVSKRFDGATRPAVDDLTLQIPAGQCVALVGPSGCGKTTTLKMINRLIEPTGGDILVGGRRILDAPVLELRRSIGYVIQQVGLFPHMTVSQNIAVVPRLLGWKESQISARIDELLTLVGLKPGEFRDRRPRQLSGGQQQRVGFARALAADPPLLLMDEPFGALDPITRGSLQSELRELQRLLRKTIVLVTHDMDEAVKLGDTIVVMRDGKIAQVGTPAELLLRPADAFVADLLGQDRLIKLLQTIPVTLMIEPPSKGAAAAAGTVSSRATMHDALLAFLPGDADHLDVVDEDRVVVGRLGRQACFSCARAV